MSSLQETRDASYGDVSINSMRKIDDLIVGISHSVRCLKQLIALVATSSAPAMIQGETGSGKELVAQALHAVSGRKGKLVAVNCAAIPADLLESELFGYEKGAFTGADRQRIGRFEMAEGGTLFLDEIGDMSLALQSKLLRALETRSIQRVGGGKDIPVDFRLVTATHRNLEQKVQEGSFRADLFYRMNVFPIVVPGLAERAQDIPLILAHITNLRQSEVSNLPCPEFDPSAQKAFAAYHWPGNVRELRNILDRAFVMFPGRVVTGRHVRENLLSLHVPEIDDYAESDALWSEAGDLDVLQEPASCNPAAPHAEAYRKWFQFSDEIDLRQHLQDIEAVLIEAALKQNEGLVARAAVTLRLRRTTLIEKMKKLGISRCAA